MSEEEKTPSANIVFLFGKDSGCQQLTAVPHLLVAEDGVIPCRAQGQGGLSTHPENGEQLGSLDVSAVTVVGTSWFWSGHVTVTRLRSHLECGCLHSDQTKPLAVHTTYAALAHTNCPQCTAAAEMGSSAPKGKNCLFYLSE